MYTITLISIVLVIIISLKKSFLRGMRALITWITQIFSRRTENHNNSSVPEIVHSESPENSHQVVPLEERKPSTPESGSQCSEDAIAATSKSIIETCSTELLHIKKGSTKNKSDKKKDKVSHRGSKKSLNEPDQFEVTFSHKSKSGAHSKSLKKKAEHVETEIKEVDVTGFTLVTKQNKKSKSQEEVQVGTSGIEDPQSKSLQSKSPEEEDKKAYDKPSNVEHYKKKLDEDSLLKESISKLPSRSYSKCSEGRESKKVDASVTYAQITSISSHSERETNFAQIEKNYQESEKADSFKPIRKKYFDSSEDNTESPFVFVETIEVHREDSSRSQNVADKQIQLPLEKINTKDNEDTSEITESDIDLEKEVDIREELTEEKKNLLDEELSSEEISKQVESNKIQPLSKKEEGKEKINKKHKEFIAEASAGQQRKKVIVKPIKKKLVKSDEDKSLKQILDQSEEERPLLELTSSESSSSSNLIKSSEFNLGVNSEEFRKCLYQNEDNIALMKKVALYHQDSQNTSNDIPSDILDSDSAKIEDKQDLSEAESSREDSSRDKSENLKKQKSKLFDKSFGSNRSEGLVEEESSQSERLGSSDFRGISFSETAEDLQDLIESSEAVVSEEIEEAENVIEEVPEVLNQACSNLFDYKYQNPKYQKDFGIFKLTKEFLSNERLNSIEKYPNYLVDTLESFVISQSNNIIEMPLSGHSKSENMSMSTLKDLKTVSTEVIETIEHDCQVRVLSLHQNSFQQSTLYRLEKNWMIEFRLGPSLFGRKISIYCDFPGEENSKLKEFVRGNYRLLEWKQDEGCENGDDTSIYAQIQCHIAGSFHFYYIDNDSVSKNKICGSGYFLVDPIISYGDNEILPLDCIQCQTVISKHIGSFSTWKDKLSVSKESGYNMIHFTPVQALGSSNSAYSIKDQLQLNPSFKRTTGQMPTWEEVKSFISTIKKEWKVTSICDIVLNHTANESIWIQEHPEVTYNCKNCMYMRPAYLLDATLNQFSMDVKAGLYETKGIPPVIDCEDHLNAMRYHLQEGVLQEVKIQELFTCDVNKCVSQFLDIARQNRPLEEVKVDAELTIIQNPEYRRLASSIDMNLALKIYNIFRPGCFDEDTRLRKCCEEFKRKLDSLNQVIIDTVRDHLNTAVENVINGVKYWRVQSDGPRLKEISIQDPLISRYFTDYGTPKSIKEYEEVMYSDKGKFLMAHNGWVQDSDPLVNFAGPQSKVYIRRELIAWGDSVKLRFGEKPSDCPFLWDHMRKYVELTASIFDGVRLDNCHSTPINVAQYLLDCARKVRPDLYVVAELFTNSDEKDNIFVNKLGISSLIREALNAWDSHEQGRLVYRFGGVPVGSFYQPNTRPLVSSIAHALFIDLTHDNPSPVDKRSVFDMLPSSALVNMACCGTGSNRGYDELVPHHISVVDETREYTEWSSKYIIDNPKYVSAESGIIAAKKALNDLHFKLGQEGFNQVYVDQMDQDVVAVTRHCPRTHRSYILVAFTAFRHPGESDYKWQRNIRPLIVEGVLDEIILEATLSHTDFSDGGAKYTQAKSFEKSSQYINGYSEYKIQMKQNIQLSQSHVFERILSENPNEVKLNFKNFKPGSVIIIKVSLPKATAEAVKNVRDLGQQFSAIKDTELKRIIKKLTLSSLNRALYRCDQEERDEGKGFDTYGIPGYGKLVYSGLQGFISLLSKIRTNNDLGHPMCDNLRNGNWMIDYIFQRLELDDGTAELGKWIEENTRSLKTLPKYLRPAYFDMVFTGIYILLIEHSYNLMSSFVNKGSVFVKALSMGSLQFAAYIKSANLPVLSPNLAKPKPTVRLDENGKEVQACVSLSAGLPHFSVGYMRNWGRDTFIALRGLFILTGRHQEARYHILGYASCLRHGLIPNLLDGGRKPRYNCRDSVWWWLYCIKCYTEDVPNGIEILEDKVSRIFPTDESPPQQPGETDQSLQDVMQETLNRHFQGVVFRERNAGREIDEHMVNSGFDNQIGVHPETGFIFGGNVNNCGTWMDKMGSSTKAGNKGKPATPRDGSACEIIGLSKCVISWLATLYTQKKYKYVGVERKHSNQNVTKWTFTFWADKIQENFEKCFWVNDKPTYGENRPDLINKRGIYKDCFGATQEWTDFQLRCNFPIVMVVAPELFNPQHAWTALKTAEIILLGPLGMKTLDPSDWAYRGDYDNSNDSEDASVAHGFNYHQGPEWVWPIGYFFRAKLHFAAKNGKLKETVAETKYKLSKHFIELQTSDWRGLPELTNSNGAYCKDSSRTQAWSMSSILEVLYDLQKIDSSV